MPLHSFFVDTQPQGRQLLIFDSVLNGKHVYTACGVVVDVDGEMQIPNVARDTLAGVVKHAERACSGGVHLVHVGCPTEAAERVIEALEDANEKDIVFFCCFGAEAHDAAVAELNPVYPSGERTAQ